MGGSTLDKKGLSKEVVLKLKLRKSQMKKIVVGEGAFQADCSMDKGAQTRKSFAQ